MSLLDNAIREWTAHGMRCAVVVNPFGGCNGYVKLPTGYPRAWQSYDDINVDAHGGLTYGPDEDGWVGFDTLHMGDWWDGKVRMPAARAADPKLTESGLDILANERGKDASRRWTEDAVAEECERLAGRLNAEMAQ